MSEARESGRVREKEVVRARDLKIKLPLRPSRE